MTKKELNNIIKESLRDWFKKEKWVRITTSGNIAGPCGTSKNKKNPDRCLPKAKAQSLTKAQRAATAQKKKKAGKKGKTVVKNTKKATVQKETKGAPKGHYFTKSGNLVKGRLTKDARERGARLSDPKDKQRSKVPPVTQYKEERMYGDSNIEDKLVQLAQSIGREKFAMHILYDMPSDVKRGIFDTLFKGGMYNIDTAVAENVAPNHNDKAAPYGSGYKKITKEDITNLVVGMIHEEKQILDEKKDDRCTRIAKRKYDTWPSAYASGAVVRCRRGEIWKKEK